MQTRKFHIGDVFALLTLIYGLSPRKEEGVLRLMFFMAQGLKEPELARVVGICQENLLKQFPRFAEPYFIYEVEALRAGLALMPNVQDVVLSDWLKEQIVKYGETFEVKQIA